MPTYEYRCPSCGHEFERFKKMSEQAHAPCPECGDQADQLISGGAGLLFKGSGFYITDYRSDSYREAAKKETKPAAEKKTGSERGSSSSDGGKRATDTGSSGPPKGSE